MIAVTIIRFVAEGAEHAAHDLTQTKSWIWPEKAEIIYGGISSLLVFAGLAKFALPMAKKSFAARTERIQKELDAASSAKSKAESDAAGIRSALGDLSAERAKLIAEADAQAAAVIADGRARLQSELADLEAKALAEIGNMQGRGSDELRSEIARLSSAVLERVTRETLDAKTQQDLIEGFISKVGA
jgi:F-type H+-transporting ATPase subunit b